MRNVGRKLVLIVLAMILLASIALAAEKKGDKVMKTLVVYYSYSGNTELVATTVANELQAQVLKIEDVKKPGKFKAYVSGGYAAMKGKSWPIKALDKNVKDFDVIFVGSPIWAGKPTPQINAFLEQADFSGKTVVVFVTMGGSDSEKALTAMSDKVKAKGGKVTSSFAIKSGGVTKEELVAKAKEFAGKNKK